MSRAKTQRPKPRGPTQSEKRRASSVAGAPFDDIEHAIDALDSFDAREAHETPIPSPPQPMREPARPKLPFPSRAPAPKEAIEGARTKRSPSPQPAKFERPNSVLQEWDAVDSNSRAISVGESVGEDQVVAVEELSELRTLLIAVHDVASHVVSARRAIIAAGHTVAITATGTEGLAPIEEAIRDGSIDTLIVGIPGGESLIDIALALAPRRPVLIASCSGSSTEAVRRATEVGADLATVRPYDLEHLAPVLLAAARLCDERHDSTNARSTEAVLRARLEALVEPEPGSLQPFELFQRVLELELKRARRYEYPIAVALFAVELAAPPLPPGVRGILRARAGNALIHSIRDIDLATEVDHERFLVLLPYTDLTGAAEVARRIIAAVASCDPVVAAGRTFPPRVVGAVAGATPGQPLSFARLMRDATHALEQARRDGAELAVQP